MTTAQEILKMIETVDPADTAKLDEIDARVWCWLNNLNFNKMTKSGVGRCGRFYEFHYNGLSTGFSGLTPQYTRSRDALKAIRPEGWCPPNISIQCKQGSSEPLVNCYIFKVSFDEILNIWGWAETEELAELHAIIQVVEYERNKE